MGGLALFLYGMHIMGEGLEVAAGSKLKGLLEKLTKNRFLGMLVGLVITAVIQSSSATTVMVVGFVNAGLMNLAQAIGVIMGANIGTTATGLLIALDIGMLAPALALIGVGLVLFSKKQKVQAIGQVLAGLGILFILFTLLPFVQLMLPADFLIPYVEGSKFMPFFSDHNFFLGALQHYVA